MLDREFFQISLTPARQFFNTCHNVSWIFGRQLYPIPVCDKCWTICVISQTPTGQFFNTYHNVNWLFLASASPNTSIFPAALRYFYNSLIYVVMWVRPSICPDVPHRCRYGNLNYFHRIFFFSVYVSFGWRYWMGLNIIIKTHVHGFFDTDLHEVSWHFATHEAVRPSGFSVQLTAWRSVSKKPFNMGFCFYPILKK